MMLNLTDFQVEMEGLRRERAGDLAQYERGVMELCDKLQAATVSTIAGVGGRTAALAAQLEELEQEARVLEEGLEGEVEVEETRVEDWGGMVERARWLEGEVRRGVEEVAGRAARSATERNRRLMAS